MPLAILTLERHSFLGYFKTRWLGLTKPEDAIVRARCTTWPFFGLRIAAHEVCHKTHANFARPTDHHDDPAWAESRGSVAHKCGLATSGLRAHLTMRHIPECCIRYAKTLLRDGKVEVEYEFGSQLDSLLGGGS